MSESEAVTKQFEAEVSQLLRLMINNLYTNKEVFLRELVSNSSDALDRLRFAALQDEDLYEDDGNFEIRVDFDEDDHTITVWDNGIGMSREDVEEDIGTIARSGTQEFMEALQQQEDPDDKLIGQFGVGFYSAFIVADRVDIETRKAGLDADEGVRWRSAGEGEYTIEEVEREQRGTEITLHLREGEDDLLDDHRLREIIGKYSDHVSFPIKMRPVETEGEDDEQDESPDNDWETVNRASALWTRRSSEISDEEYEEFYKHIARDFNEPLDWTHSQVEGRLKFTMLFYLPAQRPMDMKPGVEGDHEGIKLYVRRVFIMDDAEMFLPKYLRFVRGVLDSDDLDLNVSRETLQNNRLVSAMKNTATRKVLDMLEDLADDDPEAYQTFWDEFGGIFKEGIVEDPGNRETVAGLLRFASTRHDQPQQNVSLDEYVEKMDEDQDNIYYVTAETFEGAKNSPHLEVFRDRDVEVLLLHDRIDEWVVNNLEEYDDYKLQSVAIGDLDLEDSDEDGDEDDESMDEKERELSDLMGAIREVLGERVEDVRLTNRLRSSPACLVAQEGGVSKNFERIMQQAGQRVPSRKPILELNPDHPIVERLDEKVAEESIDEWANILFDQAWLSEGGRLEDPAGFVQRVNEKMIELLGEPSSDIITEV
jgi:molecular chaperone HtpG